MIPNLNHYAAFAFRARGLFSGSQAILPGCLKMGLYPPVPDMISRIIARSGSTRRRKIRDAQRDHPAAADEETWWEAVLRQGQPKRAPGIILNVRYEFARPRGERAKRKETPLLG